MTYMLIPTEMEEVFNGPESFRGYPTMDKPWEYLGWYIWRWTGWKGRWQVRNPLWTPREGMNWALNCRACGKPIELWDIVYDPWTVDGYYHQECAVNWALPMADGTIVGQWLAMDKLPPVPHPDTRHIYACTGGGCGYFEKGDIFDIGPSGQFTYYTDLDTLEEAKQVALDKLRSFIHQEVHNADLRVSV